MASFCNCFLFTTFVFLFVCSSAAKTPSHSKSLVLSVSKDKCSNQYTIQINQRTPSVPVKLTVDLGAGFMWVNCENGYVSSSYRPASCNSGICPLIDSVGCSEGCNNAKPGCYNGTCLHSVDNQISNLGEGGEVGEDIVSVTSFDVKNPSGRTVSLPHFPFICGSTWLSDHLADGVTGIAGLGRYNFSLPYYFSDALGLSKNFALCLSPSTENNGLVSFGDGPATANDLLTYTPLILNPVGSRLIGGSASSDYYIGVKSISVGGREIKFNKTLLSISKEGNGGTMLSTVKPYTVLHTSIYKPLVKAFLKKLNGGLFTPVVPSVPVPFGTCFDTGNFLSDEEFFSSLPVIDMELENDKGKKVYWRISSANSMVRVTRYRTCLGFLDGGSWPWGPSITIGGRQLEDNLMHFDLANSKLGFSSNLVARNTSCSSFINSTSI